MVILLNFLLTGLRFAFVIIIYIFLWNALRLMYLELRKNNFPVQHRLVLITVEAKYGGIKKGERYALGENITIGRKDDNDISINDNRVSAYHAVIKLQDDKWYLYDLGSTNGTFVNNLLLTGPYCLQLEDKVIIGGVTFKVGWEDAWRGHFPYRTGAAR